MTTEQKEKFKAEAVEVTKSLKGTCGIEVEICGMWVWIKDVTKSHENLLKTIGCKYSKNKEMWYWRNPACKYSKKRSAIAMQEVRDRHGSMRIKDIAIE